MNSENAGDLQATTLSVENHGYCIGKNLTTEASCLDVATFLIFPITTQPPELFCDHGSAVLAPGSRSLIVGAVGQGGDVVMGVSGFEVERVMQRTPSRQRRNENNEFAGQFGREATLRISGHINCDGSLAI